MVGIQVGSESKAYDWNLLKKKRIINDQVGSKKIVLALSDDGRSFVAFERPSIDAGFTLRNDTLFVANRTYNFAGHDLATLSDRLKPVNAYQEFWHSWRTFHPTTTRYE